MNYPVDDRYIFRITDDTGMLQHAVSGVPDPSEGYTTDDNARALMAAIMLYGHAREKKYEDLLYRYMGFMLYAQKSGWFRNFMGYDRNFLEKRGSEDCFGRCICALGYTVSQPGLPNYMYDCAQKLLQRTYSSCGSLSFIKGKAYALIGLVLWNNKSAAPLIKMLGEYFTDVYAQCRREDWRWFEDKMTYCNGVLPLAVFYAYDVSGKKEYLSVGLESLDFLIETTMSTGVFKPVGCKGWFPKGGKPAEFDQQPVEACSMMMACLKAYKLTGKPNYKDCARKSFMWYNGMNSMNQTMIDEETGGCLDGIFPTGFNKNEGAESIVCYIMSLLTAESENL